jgi:hypothetical protein
MEGDEGDVRTRRAQRMQHCGSRDPESACLTCAACIATPGQRRPAVTATEEPLTHLGGHAAADAHAHAQAPVGRTGKGPGGRAGRA